MTSKAPLTVRCPGCGGASLYAPANVWRPFCSERCRDVDLGAWANESYRVPERSTAEDNDDEAAAPPSSH